MQNIFDFADDLGPIKIVHLYDPKSGLKAVVAVDNVARGPSIGGIRMATDVSAEEAFRLARAMTMKNSAADLPHGGGKSVIFGDPKMDIQKKELVIRAFARAIRDLVEYIPGPDMGTDERCMAWIKDEIGRAVGLPPEIGGIPLDEIGATGLGLRASVEAAIKYCDFDLKGARVVVQGFGSVGKHAARFLAAKGAVLIAACDSRGTIFNPKGIDVTRLIALKNSGRNVSDYSEGRKARCRRGDRRRMRHLDSGGPSGCHPQRQRRTTQNQARSPRRKHSVHAGSRKNSTRQRCLGDPRLYRQRRRRDLRIR